MAAPGIIGAIGEESIEEPRQVRLRDAGTAISHGHAARVTVEADPHLNGRAGWREADRVREKILEYVHDRVPVSLARHLPATSSQISVSGAVAWAPAVTARTMSGRSTTVDRPCSSSPSMRASSRRPDTSR